MSISLLVGSLTFKNDLSSGPVADARFSIEAHLKVKKNGKTDIRSIGSD